MQSFLFLFFLGVPHYLDSIFPFPTFSPQFFPTPPLTLYISLSNFLFSVRPEECLIEWERAIMLLSVCQVVKRTPAVSLSFLYLSNHLSSLIECISQSIQTHHSLMHSSNIACILRNLPCLTFISTVLVAL